jgi:hypothetical protein
MTLPSLKLIYSCFDYSKQQAGLVSNKTGVVPDMPDTTTDISAWRYQ